MPGITDHPSLELVKGLIVGVPGSGKTGGLVSLVKAGYKVRVYDFDNLLASLVQLVLNQCPELADNVHYQIFTDKFAGVDNPMIMVNKAMKVVPFIKENPTAFRRALDQLNHWRVRANGEVVEDLGKPSEWGRESVLVLDSLTTCSNAAFRYVQGMNPDAREPQSYYHAAQQMILNLINLLTSASFNTNVLVLAHIYYERDDEGHILKGWPRTIGGALNDQIAGYFNCALQVERRGDKRFLRTSANGLIDLKNPMAFKVPAEYPLETGYADFFRAVTKPLNGATNA